MSGIISDKAFNNVFTATKDDSTMQALVTAVYELGMCLLEGHLHCSYIMFTRLTSPPQ